ncbi:hypothetical protein HLRTI_000994 [Halorhabdus tiamatea SARL4B]|uniref:Uncharacterized protein n=1 Tax=Halorhabdus tiamatea SARL4B TaxID=1033806 RepID=U2E4R0_9EURY|nr:hypothetical protein [Halorhabdus tiamatea]ERJ06916.1 hypothetical protein HLRTI_000994 [Halorhabdus tiamatea SARL4B]
MNKHFEDARYYLKRAGETAKKGVEAELEPVRERFTELTGEEEPEPEPNRLEKIRADLKEVQENAEGEAKEAIKDAREKIDDYRAE